MEFLQIVLIGRYCSRPGILFRLQVLYKSFNNSTHSNSSSLNGIDFKEEDTMCVVEITLYGYLMNPPQNAIKASLNCVLRVSKGRAPQILRVLTFKWIASVDMFRCE